MSLIGLHEKKNELNGIVLHVNVVRKTKTSGEVVNILDGKGE